MEYGDIPNFIVVDDDTTSNMICSMIIELAIPGATVVAFTLPEEGLAHILANYSSNTSRNAIVLLDINMPGLDGWDFLEKFSGFPEEIKRRVSIFMLSSSVTPQDKERAGNNSLVSGFIAKALSVAKVRELCPL